MTYSSETTSIADATPQELNEIIVELEQYRERLVEDTLTMAKRAKTMKSQAMANLEPQLAEIDQTLQALRQQQAILTASD